MKRVPHRSAFETFAQRAREELGSSLRTLILYGSVARGEQTVESDVDAFAVVETADQKQLLERLGAEIGVEHGMLVVPIVKTEREYEHGRKRNTAVRSRKTVSSTSDRLADYLELCKEALDDHEKCKAANASYQVLYNRLYYACFYAANAALLSHGIETRTHKGVANRVFQVLYQDEGLLPRETAVFLSRVQARETPLTTMSISRARQRSYARSSVVFVN